MHSKRKKSRFQVCYKRRKGKANAFLCGSKLNRSLIPEPASVLMQFGVKVKYTNKAGYLVCNCPFHEETNPSFNMHSIEGNFKCYSCGVKGGDVIAFYQQKTGKRFVYTIKDLGAWEVR